ncbi:hypothetical protein FRACYDRAFT_236374 [Fragilariopsis cylindrus CCMP1102]|uniref:Uncharacterized protein n=1 Tax=Fragilariopsis cylindrus CCMP1102 TaxID=635003 RepID=A0A1E7FQ46_9STRA|nr:hypothetical protein FRACYDRAFT_236374 [Fragilariopsis cylindrus CCMP1102]|eukprot:OEU20299.1 hypothetical protein FRACYDRAFT_236374 [Fragilariopsis cylindrus CCMP1102]
MPTRPTGGSGGTASSSSSAQTTTTTKELEHEKLMKDSIVALSAIAGAVLLLKAVAASISVYLAMIPILYIYGVNTCPPASSFDAKQQLRIVMRGDQLPENHPQKPNNKANILESFFASAKAVVASELATLPGYSIDITSLMGAALFATVTMPTADLECYWVGCNHHWYYWGSKNLSSEHETNENIAVPGVSSTHQGKNVYNKPPDKSTATIKIGKTNIKFDFKEE